MSLAAIGPKPFDSSLTKVIQPGGWRECLGPNGTTFEQFVSRGASIDRSATIMLVDLNKQPLSEEQLQQLCTLLQGYAGVLLWLLPLILNHHTLPQAFSLQSALCLRT